MPLASALTASRQRAEMAKAERQRLERRNRLSSQRRRQSLPCNAFHSNSTSTADGCAGTKASFSKIDAFRAIHRERSSGSLAPDGNDGSKENKKPAHSKAAAEVIRRRTSTGTSNAVRTKTTRLSPILTRSVTKKEREKLGEMPVAADIAVPKVLLFSPPNQAANERREQERIAQKEAERYVLLLVFVAQYQLFQTTRLTFRSSCSQQRIDHMRRNGLLVNVSLQGENQETANVQEELAQLRAVNDNLASTNQELDESLKQSRYHIEHLERDTVPTLEASLEMERDSVARLEAQVETHLCELEECQIAARALQAKLNDLQLENEHERQRVQQLTNNNSMVKSELTEAIAKKEKEITIMLEEFERNEIELQEKLQRATASCASLEDAKASMVAEVKACNDALTESMDQVDQLEKEKKQLEEMLRSTSKQLETARSAVAAKGTETCSIVDELTSQLCHERRLREEADAFSKETEEKLKAVTKEYDAARLEWAGLQEREQDMLQQLSHSDQIRREMHNRLMQLMGNIRVFVRVRPALPHELEEAKAKSALANSVSAKMPGAWRANQNKRKRSDMEEESPFTFPGVLDERSSKRFHTSTPGDDLTKNFIEVLEPSKDRGGLQDRRKKWRFGFDRVFIPADGQDDVWEASKPLVECAVDGSHVTIFAYGQTGSGVSSRVGQGQNGNCNWLTPPRLSVLFS
jgi:DNA repair exonuclease SbcCD ATPase subunit